MPEKNGLHIRYFDEHGLLQIDEYGVKDKQAALQLINEYMEQYRDVQFTWSFDPFKF